MKVKRIGDRIQATIDPAEILKLSATNPTDPEHQYSYPTVSDAIRGGIWRLMQAHALDKLDGMSIGWGKVDYIDGSFLVTFGPASFTPDRVQVPESRDG